MYRLQHSLARSLVDRMPGEDPSAPPPITTAPPPPTPAGLPSTSSPPKASGSNSPKNDDTLLGDTRKTGIFEMIMKILLLPTDKSVLSVAPEIGHLSPVIFTLGSLFLSIVTLNYPVFLFSFASGEATLIHSLFSSIAQYFITPFLGQMSDKKRDSSSCKSYFQGMTPMRFSALLSKGNANEFPNTALYFITFAATYCIQSLSVFNEETSELGPAYSNRPYIALAGGLMFIVLYMLYLSTYGCDSIFTLIFSVIIGAIVGSFLCYQNYILFGKSGVNLLFIPTLEKRTGMDYICVSTR